MLETVLSHLKSIRNKIKHYFDVRLRALNTSLLFTSISDWLFHETLLTFVVGFCTDALSNSKLTAGWQIFFAFFVVVSIIDEVTTKRCLAFNQSINPYLHSLLLKIRNYNNENIKGRN